MKVEEGSGTRNSLFVWAKQPGLSPLILIVLTQDT
jgi:hypothetical protein